MNTTLKYYQHESNKPHLDYNYYSPTILYGITTPSLSDVLLEVRDFFTSKKTTMKAFKKLVETARKAQNNLPDKRRIDLLQLEIEERVWISQHEAMQHFLRKCAELNLPTSESTYDKLLKALCKGTESQDEHFLLYLRSQQDALIAFCEKTDQDYTDEQVTERYFRFEVLDRYDQESVDFWAAFA